MLGKSLYLSDHYIRFIFSCFEATVLYTVGLFMCTGSTVQLISKLIVFDMNACLIGSVHITTVSDIKHIRILDWLDIWEYNISLLLAGLVMITCNDRVPCT